MGFDIKKYLAENKIELGSVKKEVGTHVSKGISDIRKTQYDVRITENGKLDLYTHKAIITGNNPSSLNETKIADIIDSYKNTDAEVIKAKKELDAAQQKYNSIGAKLSSQGNKLANGYMIKLASILEKKLYDVNRDSYGNLIELFVDNRMGKVAIHNGIYRGNYEGITYFIRDERSLQKITKLIPQKLTETQTADFLINEIKKFDKKYKTGIKWFK